VNVILNVPSPAPVAILGKIMSSQTTLPSGESEPVALPMSGGFAAVPLLDPLREYVTSIVAACAVVAAQKLSAKAPATISRKVLEFTLHILSFRFQHASEPPGPSRSRKLVVKPLLTAKPLCFMQLGMPLTTSVR
jgi:hypothetical protein